MRRSTKNTVFSRRWCWHFGYRIGFVLAGPERVRRVGDGVVAVLLVVLAWYIGSSALHAGLPPQLLQAQEKTCAIREDVCRIVATLRASGERTFALAADLTPEVSQRVTELGYPLRVAKQAPLRIVLCSASMPGDRVAVRVKDTKRPDDGNAELCVVDRR